MDIVAMTRTHRLLLALGATALLVGPGVALAQSGRISVEIDQAQRVQLRGPTSRWWTPIRSTSPARAMA